MVVSLAVSSFVVRKLIPVAKRSIEEFRTNGESSVNSGANLHSTAKGRGMRLPGNQAAAAQRLRDRVGKVEEKNKDASSSRWNVGVNGTFHFTSACPLRFPCKLAPS